MQNPGEFQSDLEKYYRIEFGGETPTLKRRVKLWTTHFGLHCVAVYRLGRFSRSLMRRNPLAIPLVLAYEFLGFLVRLIHHVDIFAADIGPGLYIGHPGTIYIGRTKVGSNFSVTHNVTIGLGAARGSAGVPVLGDDVWVGAGSILYGDISIGSGVTINGGSVLSRTLPDRCLAGGNPGRILLMNYDNASLFGGYYGGPTLEVPTEASHGIHGAKAHAEVSTADPEPSVPVTTVPVTALQLAVSAATAGVASGADKEPAPATVTPVVLTEVPAAPAMAPQIAPTPVTAALEAAAPAAAQTVTAATVTPISVAPIAAAQEVPAEAA